MRDDPSSGTVLDMRQQSGSAQAPGGYLEMTEAPAVGSWLGAGSGGPGRNVTPVKVDTPAEQEPHR